MLKIESQIQEIEKPIAEVFSFLQILNNTGKLMPDQIINWLGDQETCSYTIKGMADITMKIISFNSPNSIVIQSTSDKPFPFSLTYQLTENGPSKTNAQFIFDGDVNPFLKIMVEKPMTNLVNFMVSRIPRNVV